jgi:soluble lytic murein transglycosylase-like protein
MKSVLALVPAAIVAGALMNVPAWAKCEDHGGCITHRAETKTKVAKAKSARSRSAYAKTRRTRLASAHVGHRRGATTVRKLRDLADRRIAHAARVVPFDPPSEETGNRVVAMIKSMAPSYGVPTWFALRIAKIESNYNPLVRGRAGEYGIFQIKCDTARGLGMQGGCAQLADAPTNIEWGLKHLQAAVKASNGNLRLAASKHNAGLGRRTIVPQYVNMVF